MFDPQRAAETAPVNWLLGASMASDTLMVLLHCADVLPANPSALAPHTPTHLSTSLPFMFSPLSNQAKGWNYRAELVTWVACLGTQRKSTLLRRIRIHEQVEPGVSW